jgi:hypothetical protein
MMGLCGGGFKWFEDDLGARSCPLEDSEATDSGGIAEETVP